MVQVGVLNVLVRFLILLISFNCSLWAEYELSMCTIFQNDADYLKEWIEFHKIQGVQHFYLYNNKSEDDYMSVLEPYIAKNEVTLVQWAYSYDYGDHSQWIAIQSGAYMDCVKNYKESKWLAVIDTDEFLFCPTGEKLTSFLERYTEFGGVCVNWLNFGTSDIEDIPPGYLMIELLTSCMSPDDVRNQFIKSIVQPKYVKDCKSAHVFNFIEGKYSVNVKGRRIKGEYSKKIFLDEIRINHYWTRTERYFREVKIPSRQKRREGYPIEVMMAMAEECNREVDRAILCYVDELRKAMNFSDNAPVTSLLSDWQKSHVR